MVKGMDFQCRAAYWQSDRKINNNIYPAWLQGWFPCMLILMFTPGVEDKASLLREHFKLCLRFFNFQVCVWVCCLFSSSVSDIPCSQNKKQNGLSPLLAHIQRCKHTHIQSPVSLTWSRGNFLFCSHVCIFRWVELECFSLALGQGFCPPGIQTSIGFSVL